MHQTNRAAKSFKGPGKKLAKNSPPGIIINYDDQEGNMHVQGYTHSGAIRAGCGADLKAFPKLHTDPSTQGRSLTGTRGFNTTCDQTLRELCIVSYYDPRVTPTNNMITPGSLKNRAHVQGCALSGTVRVGTSKLLVPAECGINK